MNPKAYLFMVAVYRGFLKPDLWVDLGAGLVMGVMTMATQATVYGTLARPAARSRALLVSNPKATILVGRIAGAPPDRRFDPHGMARLARAGVSGECETI